MKVKILGMSLLQTLLCIVQSLRLADVNNWISFKFTEKKTEEVYSVPSAFEAIEFEEDTSEEILLIQISRDEAMKEILLDTQKDQLALTYRLNVKGAKHTSDTLYVKMTCLRCLKGGVYENKFKCLSGESSRNNLASTITPIEITDNQLINPLDFSFQKEYGFYYRLSSLPPNEAGALLLFFDQQEDLSGSNFKFIAKGRTVESYDMSIYVPTEDETSDFLFLQEKNQNVRLYFDTVSGISGDYVFF